MILQFIVNAELRPALSEMGVRTPTFLLSFHLSFSYLLWETSQVL